MATKKKTYNFAAISKAIGEMESAGVNAFSLLQADVIANGGGVNGIELDKYTGSFRTGIIPKSMTRLPPLKKRSLRRVKKSRSAKAGRLTVRLPGLMMHLNW